MHKDTARLPARLLGRIGHVQVQVQPRVFLRRGLAALQRDLCPGTAGRHQHRRPPAESVFAQLVAQRLAPEVRRPPDIADAKCDQSYLQHAPILATAPLSRNGYRRARILCAAKHGAESTNILNCRCPGSV